MRSIFRQALVVLAISAVFLLSSCGDDNEAEPTVPPEITLSTPTGSTTVWNTVKLAIAADTEYEIDKVELRIDGVAVGDATSLPYEFNWDTSTADDGPHTAIATITDKSGNEKTIELNLNVQNTLLEATVNDDMLRTQGVWSYDERGFIFLSDEDGNVIVAQEFKNGDDISLKVPSFEGAEFTINEVVTRPWNVAYTLTTITTTTHVSRGKWVLKAPYSQVSAELQKSLLRIATPTLPISWARMIWALITSAVRRSTA